MAAGSLRNALFTKINNHVFYGWVILGFAALGMFASGPGQSHTFSVFIRPISEDLGIGATSIASAYAFATLAAAFGLPHMGRLVDRFGPRRMVLIVSLLLGVACIAFGAAANMIWLALGFAALRFLGQGSLMLNCSNLVAQWFNRRRGFALSLMALGFAGSMAVHPPLGQWLIDLVGWRQAWLWLGVLTWILLLPPILLLVHNKPEDMGVLPDGDDRAAVQQADQPAPAQTAEAGLTLSEALRTATFWIVAIGLFAMAMLVTALHFFQVSVFEAHGLSPQIAARVFPVSAITMVVLMPLVGRMLDRFRTSYMFAASLLVMSAALIAMSGVRDLPTALLYAVVFGLNNAVSLTLFSFLWPHYFGRRHLGSIQGAGQMIGVVGASLGPLPLGIAFDLLGSYDETLWVMAILPVICAVLALFLREPTANTVAKSTA